MRSLFSIAALPWRYLAGTTAAVCLIAVTAFSGESPPAVDYLTQVKPLLAARCGKCHGDVVQKGSLRLDSGKAILAGGDTGEAVLPGKAADSLLVQAVSGTGANVEKMPPKGEPGLKPDEIALLTRWVAEGAKFPADEAAGSVKKKTSNHWSFQPIVAPAVPNVPRTNWARNPIDQFVVAELEKKKLRPNPEADRATLIRRVTLDLTGLLPTPAEVKAFVDDQSPRAWETVVERLLASPHYGERWGRHWLDQAHYADSNGYTIDSAREIWKYREWVIDAFNRDVPFDQFVIEQLAGDLLPDARMEQRIATGFLRNTLVNEEGGTDQEQFRNEAMYDRVSTVGVVFLGLTLGCAQCHDHKYDPISQREFYQLFAFLNNCDEPKIEVLTPEEQKAGLLAKRDAIRKELAELAEVTKKRQKELQECIDAWEKRLSMEERDALPRDVLNAVSLAPVMRDKKNLKDLEDYYKSLPEARERFPELERAFHLKKEEPKFVTTLVMQERGTPRDTHVHVRGDFLRKGARVAPAVPEVLPALGVSAENGANAAASRLALAKWLVDKGNPLTPRVTVNRVWLRYFGRGLVETENDFGLQGTPPTHPELLDWLASQFINQKFRLKDLHRLIVNSATYRQSSRYRPEVAEVDPHNKLYARQSRLRLDAEAIRDAGLSASGLLVSKVGGPSVYPPQPEGVYDFTQLKKQWPTAKGDDRFRRALYTFLWRSAPYPTLTVFDFPDANASCTRRVRSNTPLQSLTLANDQTFVEFAQGLAKRLLASPATAPIDRLNEAFEICLARSPSNRERERLLEYFTQQQSYYVAHPDEAAKLQPKSFLATGSPADFAAWTNVARVLLNLDEFITRE